MAAALTGIAERGALLRAAVHLADERVDVDDQAPVTGPGARARVSVSPRTRSSWRTCPIVNDRKNVPSVDGAATAWPST